MITVMIVLLLVLVFVIFFFFIKPIRIPDGSPTHKQADALYQRDKAFTDWLPYVEFDQTTQTFLLEDGYSVGALLHVNVVATEAKPDEYLADIEDKLVSVLNHAVPQDDNPYIVQFFVADSNDVQPFIDRYHAYFSTQNNRFTKNFLIHMVKHFKALANPEGYFVDNTVTGSAWSAKQRGVYVCLYKRLNAKERLAEQGYLSKKKGSYAPASALNRVVEKFVTQLQSMGIKAQRGQEADLVHWLQTWFNPGVTLPGRSTLAWQKDKPFGYDLSQQLTLSQPTSDAEKGNWYFNDKPHRVIVVDGLRLVPNYGHLTGERVMGEHRYALFDQLPAGCTVNVTVVIKAQDVVQNHLAMLKTSSKGPSTESMLTSEDADKALQAIQQGDHLYPCVMTVFVRGEDDEDLKQKLEAVQALLVSNGLLSVAEHNMLVPLDVYIRNLPFNYEPQRDKVFPLSRYVFASHISRLLPLWGRGRGTGNPGLVFYNRGAEPLVFDPLNPQDRASNAFGLILGPPGSGKSALMVYLLLQFIARYNARVFIIEKGESFKLVGEHCKNMGLEVNSVFLHPKYDVSLPPFANALTMLAMEEERHASLQSVDTLIERDLDSFDSSQMDQHVQAAQSDQDTERDFLGEMELVARFMITGGDQKEEDALSRADRLLIRHAIVNAALKKREQLQESPNTDPTVLTEDVVEELRLLSQSEERREQRRARAQEMADAMELFCSGVQGHFFNRPGKLWPESDVTIMDIGLFSQEAYKDGLAVAFTSLMNMIAGIAERDQQSDRPIILLGDESHLFFQNPLLAVYFVKMTKMFRKLGCWPWMATQNLEDFSHDARKMLSMVEWFIAMTCPKEQVELIGEVRDLSEEQKALLLSTRKESKKYTEGVVMGKTVLSLIRNVPPPLALALAQTEQHEKAHRANIMKQQQCSEIEAAYQIAASMSKEENP